MSIRTFALAMLISACSVSSQNNTAETHTPLENRVQTCEIVNPLNFKIEIGVATNFPSKYYKLVSSYLENKQQKSSLFEFVDFFYDKDFEVKKYSQENFVSLGEKSNPSWGMNVRPLYGELEVIFVSPVIGFTFHGLAYDTADSSFPDLVPSPRYPRIPIPSEDKLNMLAEEIYELYQSLKTAILKGCE